MNPILSQDLHTRAKDFVKEFGPSLRHVANVCQSRGITHSRHWVSGWNSDGPDTEGTDEIHADAVIRRMLSGVEACDAAGIIVRGTTRSYTRDANDWLALLASGFLPQLEALARSIATAAPDPASLSGEDKEIVVAFDELSAFVRDMRASGRFASLIDAIIREQKANSRLGQAGAREKEADEERRFEVFVRAVAGSRPESSRGGGPK